MGNIQFWTVVTSGRKEDQCDGLGEGNQQNLVAFCNVLLLKNKQKI